MMRSTRTATALVHRLILALLIVFFAGNTLAGEDEKKPKKPGNRIAFGVAAGLGRFETGGP